MPVITAGIGSASVSGYGARVGNASTLHVGTATAVGYPAKVWHPVEVGTAPDALRLEILTSAGVQVDGDYEQRRGLSFSVEHNGSGAITFDTDLSALPLGIDDPRLAPTNVVRVHFGYDATAPYGVAEGILAAAPPSKNDLGDFNVQIPCPGSWDALDFGELWPTIAQAGDTREFSYTAGQTSSWYHPDEWAAPPGHKLVKDSFRWTTGKRPHNWPENKAKWLWPTSPENNSPKGTVAFRSTVNFPHAGDYKFYFAADDKGSLYVDGTKIKSRSGGAWKDTSSVTRRITAGDHTVAANVTNSSGGKSGYLCAIKRVSNGAWIFRTSETNTVYRKTIGWTEAVPLPPIGWYPPAVLRLHVQEAAARGVLFHNLMSLTYSDTADSTGSGWTENGTSEYDIGISGVELGEKIRSVGYDLAMLPGFRLAAWKHRGFDLRTYVTIRHPQNVSYPARSWSRVRTYGLTHFEGGWEETLGPDAAINAAYGRREAAYSAGGVQDAAGADGFATAAMNATGLPEETVEVTFTSADLAGGTPWPFRDYNVADIITVEGVGRFIPIKVMSIAGAEQPTKEVVFTVSGYPVS